MMPLGSIGPIGGRRPPDGRRRLRLGIAVAVTFATLVVLWFAGRGGDAPDKVAVQSAQLRRTTTTATHASSTTVYTVALDPRWLPKGSSSYSDSDAKRRRASLPSASTTTIAAVESSTTIGSQRSRTTTTIRRRSTTTLRSRSAVQTTIPSHTTTRPAAPTTATPTSTPPG